MLRSIALILVTLCLLAGCGEPGWREHSPPDASFTVTLPGRTRTESGMAQSEYGPVARFRFAATLGDTVFRAGYNQYPDSIVARFDAGSLLDAAVKRIAENAAGAVQSERELTLDGWPGRELQVLNLRGTVTVFARVYLVGSRQYQLVVAVPAAGATPAAVERFWSSFRLGH